MNRGRAQQARCDERAARDLRERECGRMASQATAIALCDAQIAAIDSIQASIARAEALIAGQEN
ncbi:hypothetical protein CMI47_05710 [Candidatus Pacearchaeota archaeon]|jgi:hypothetical protein|nr:hypothetical protein [Candidatus Pacearchaeota archaeon]|tara:strand:- start:553 stop:744 length:192 start_codon:yes stop_codon:yes gene_type:complete